MEALVFAATLLSCAMIGFWVRKRAADDETRAYIRELAFYLDAQKHLAEWRAIEAARPYLLHARVVEPAPDTEPMAEIAIEADPWAPEVTREVDLSDVAQAAERAHRTADVARLAVARLAAERARRAS